MKQLLVVLAGMVLAGAVQAGNWVGRFDAGGSATLGCAGYDRLYGISRSTSIGPWPCATDEGLGGADSGG